MIYYIQCRHQVSRKNPQTRKQAEYGSSTEKPRNHITEEYDFFYIRESRGFKSTKYAEVG